MIERPKLFWVQTVLTREDITKLKAKTKASSISDALAKAVYHYLECPEEGIKAGKGK